MLNILRDAVSNTRADYTQAGSITGIGHLFAIAVNFITAVGFAISFVGIGYACIQFVLSRGDKNELEKAKTSLTWSVIAAFITMFAFVFKQILFGLIGVGGDAANDVPAF